MPAADDTGAGIRYSTANGCVLHYALNRLRAQRIGRLEDDVPLVEILDATTGPITIVIVQVDRKKLAGQYAMRMFGWHAGDTQVGGRKFVRRALGLVRGLDIRKLRQLIRDRYSDNAVRLYSRWELLVSEIVQRRRQGRGARVRIVHVEPDATAGSGRGFRLLSCSND
jgi:hypothetical protein